MYVSAAVKQPRHDSYQSLHLVPNLEIRGVVPPLPLPLYGVSFD
jgi:hypothetical protein